MRKFLIFLNSFILIISSQYKINGQCCSSCPNTPNINFFRDTITVSGSTNDILGSNGQALKRLFLDMDVVDPKDLEITLFFPGTGNDIILQNDNTGAPSTTNRLLLCFIDCASNPDPDPNYLPFINWSISINFPSGLISGSYYPAEYGLGACFEDFNGISINGDWILEIEVAPGGVADYTINDWSLDFADETGLNTCATPTCGQEPCEANGGDIGGGSLVSACEGDPSLDFTGNLPPTYNQGSAPPSATYDYQYLIYERGSETIIAYEPTPDLSTFDPGEYTICGLSVLNDDISELPGPNGTLTRTDLQNDIDADIICANISSSCQDVDILPKPVKPILNGPLQVCTEDTSTYTIQNVQPNTIYSFNWTPNTNGFVNEGGTFLDIQWTENTHTLIVTADSLGCVNADTLTINLLPQEEFDLTGPTQVCKDLSASYSFGITTTPSQTVNVNTNGGGTITNVNTNSTTIIWQNPGSYELIVSGTNFNCPPEPDTLEVTVISPPTVTNIATNCNPDGTYFVSFNINGGAPPYDISPSGTLNGSSYTSDPIQSGNSTTFIVSNISLTSCDTSFTVNETCPCQADGGDIGGAVENYCEGDSSLVYNFTPSFSGNSPDPAFFDYTLFVVDNATDIILDTGQTLDLTTFTPGTYTICGLSILKSDRPNLPAPNGNYRITDLENDIINEVICASVSTGCANINIDPLPEQVELSGPNEVCERETLNYIIDNFDPANNYNISTPLGTPATLSQNNELIIISWDNGPAQLCVEASNSCGTTDSCIDITVNPPSPPVTVSGPLTVCDGETATYSIFPALSTGETFDVTLIGGTETGRTNSSIDITWTANSGNNQVIIGIIGGICPYEPDTIDVDVVEFTVPDFNFAPNSYCLGDTGTINVSDDSITLWSWSGSGINILSGNDSEFMTFEVTDPNTFEICVEVTTTCGIFSRCETIDVSPSPDVNIIPFSDPCFNTITISGNPGNAANLNWSENGNSGIIFNSPNSATTSITLPGPGSYSIIFLGNSGTCSDSDTFNFQAFQGPTITNFDTTCAANGDYTVSFDINGSEPFTVNSIPASSNFVSSPFASGDSFNFTIEDANGCDTTFTGAFTCPCFTNAGSISANVSDACLPNSVQIASNGDSLLDPNDTYTYVLHDGDINTIGNIIDQNQTGIFSSNTVGTFFIHLIAGNNIGGEVDFTDRCFSQSNGLPVNFLEPTNPTYNGQSNFCSVDFSLSVDLASPQTFAEWTQINGPPNGVSTFSDNSSPFTVVSVSQEGSYSYQFIAGNGVCNDTILIDITAQAPPEYRIDSIVCATTSDIQVYLKILSNNAPLSINGLPGILDDSIFISDIVPNQSYNITIEDNLDCSQNFTLGPVGCNCISQAGQMADIPLNLCENADSIHLDFLGGNTLEANDTFGFVIHRGSSNVIVDSVFYSFSSSFPKPESLGPGSYFVSVVVGDSLNGKVNLNDTCLSVSSGQALNILPIPQFTLPDTFFGCGQSDIEVTISSGNFDSLNVLVPDEIALSASTDSSIILNADTAGLFMLEYKQFSNTCSFQDSFYLNIPNTFNRTIVTNCVDSFYDLSIQLQGGYPPYRLQGIFPGSISLDSILPTSNFSLDSLDSKDSLNFVISDSRKCHLDSFLITADCSCPFNAGNIALASTLFCAGDSLILDEIQLSDTIIESGQSSYAVFDSTDSNIEDSLFTISSGAFILDTSLFELNREYYIALLVSDTINNEIDYSSNCLDYSNFLGFRILPNSSVSFEGDFESCEGDLISVPIDIQGTFPIELFYSNNQGVSESKIITNPADSNLSITASENLEFIVLDSISGNCYNWNSDSILFSIQEAQTVSFNQVDTICNNDSFGASINLNTLLSQNYNGQWISSDGLDINSSSILNADGVSSGSYNLSFITTGFEDPCPGDTFTTQIYIRDCQCPQIVLDEIPRLCNSSDNFDLENIISTNLIGTWSVRNPNGLDDPPFISGTILNISDATAGSYTVAYTIDSDLPDNCDSVFTQTVIIEEALSAGNALNAPTFCTNDSIQLRLNDWIENEDIGGRWYLSGNPLNSGTINSSDLNIGDNSFRYEITSTSSCPGDETILNIVLVQALDYNLEVSPIRCFGEANGAINVNLNSMDSAIIRLNGQNATQTISNLSAGNYVLEVENSQGCIDSSYVTLKQPPQLSVDLGDDTTVTEGSIVSILADVSPDTISVSNIIWTINGMNINENSLQINPTINDNSAIRVIIEDVNGCTAIDETNILVREIASSLEYYIPNIFNPISQIEENRRFGLFSPENDLNIRYFAVYDRWGNQMFSIKDVPAGDPTSYWNGITNGQLANVGVYVYTMELEQINTGRKITLKGSVTLLKQ